MANVRFLKERDIEMEAEALLTQYEKAFGPLKELPIPIESILESHLGLTIDFDALSAAFGEEVLGACYMNTKRIVVDESLDPTQSPHQEGRYRFTLAHEAGHWSLHRRYFIPDPRQGLLFPSDGKPSWICRKKSNKEPMEWQADKFAAHLLMPRAWMMNEWTRVAQGRPFVTVREIQSATSAIENADAMNVVNTLAGEMSTRFQVSTEAMRYRLVELGLIQTEVPMLDLAVS